MSEQIWIRVPGRPIPWSRARPKIGGGYYTARPQREYMEIVRQTAAVEMRRYRATMAQRGVPVTLEVLWCLPHPQNARAAIRQETVPMAVHPDFDNCMKIVADALTGIVYEDDAQVSDGFLRKRYVPRGEERLAITVKW